MPNIIRGNIVNYSFDESTESLPPITVKINFFTGTADGWVSTGATSPSISTTTDFGEMQNGVGLRSTSDNSTYRWNNTNAAGTTTGNNSGVFPDAIMLTYWYTNDAFIGRLELYNHTGTPLNGRTFTLKVHGGRSVTGPRTTEYRVNGGSWFPLDCANNTQNVITFTGVTAVADVIELQLRSTTPTDAAFGYLNGLTLESE
jgi:hypothetical protein